MGKKACEARAHAHDCIAAQREDRDGDTVKIAYDHDQPEFRPARRSSFAHVGKGK